MMQCDSTGTSFATACWGVAQWPLPGQGATLGRLELLAEACRKDVAVGRLVEAHADALAILAELGCPEYPRGTGADERRWGVWAAGPANALRAERRGGHWRLSGTKRWCSGATLVTHALVDATTDRGQQLFAIDVSAAGVGVRPPDWIGPGMARADTRRVDCVEVDAAPVGAPGSYLNRPGFWAGAIGVAACWHGGTIAVAEALWTGAQSGADPHQLAHLGRVNVALTQNGALLRWAAEELDQAPNTPQAILARTVRATIAANVTAVIDSVGRALGPAPLAFDAHHIEAVFDLQVYVRQEHAERDLEALGADLAGGGHKWRF
jgi:alkylation response protein AidB-like acyl-CoA dehydrogenase